ncbi:leucyl aminopeptidase [Desnuesiella massiliensis]|uniref:leucyl aminopeptidase n=1 Tax=Desnuesiella massiliensis TaxID=1650662 RepID=UPI0006E230A8|nr:leucyl aminopeptidase [Desnuesiella massiliensis]
MNFLVRTGQSIEADVLVYPIFMEDALDNLSQDLKTVFEGLKSKERFKAELGQVYLFSERLQGEIKDIIFVGLGKKEELSAEKIRIALANVLKKGKELGIESIAVQAISSDKLCFKRTVKAMVEGMALANYKFDKYKTDRKEGKLKEIYILNVVEEKVEKAEKAIKEAEALVEATLCARNLVNEPANVITPKELGKKAKAIGKEAGFEVEIFDEKEIEALGMKSFLEVAKGSDNAPRFIVMRYFGDEDNKNDILGLVGKGLTYDSGGYSIKPTDGMVTMKSDMGGAAAVIGAMKAIAETKLKANVVAVVAACENMISGKAYKPGDIISSMAGKTIEVLNTDAEGRLTLIDAVHYVIEKEKATKVIDVATLTGAVLIALGNTTTGVVTNNEEFYNDLQRASELSGEKFWQLPAFDEYKKLIKSDIADLKNIGGRHAGTITAGLFIGEFVQKKPWLHLDIAGTAWADSDKDYITKGGTGAPVRTLYYLVKEKNSCCNK